VSAERADAPTWPGYPDAPRPIGRARPPYSGIDFAPLDQLPADSDRLQAIIDAQRATLAEVRAALLAMPGESTPDAARRVMLVASEAVELIRSRGLAPALRAEVRRREAEGVVPATRAEVVGADLELAAATPEEQASASIRLCEEREGRRLTAAELGARFAPTYAWIRALAALIAARAEAERRAAGGRDPTIDLDEIEVGEGRR